MTTYGYAGRVLRVDLGTGKIEKGPLDIGLARRFVGGAGMNCALFEGLHKPGEPPFSPDNPIVLGAGPLVGTRIPGTGKVEGTTKFSLSATEDGRCYVASASSGSRRFGVMLKRAGYDHLVITGRAPKPVLIRIRDGEVEIADANRSFGQQNQSAYKIVQDVLAAKADPDGHGTTHKREYSDGQIDGLEGDEAEHGQQNVERNRLQRASSPLVHPEPWQNPAADQSAQPP
jgi:aldehyde:ferredoxin oxidoreductase